MDNQISLRKIAITLISVLIFIVLLEAVWHYFHTGTIVVVTDNPNDTITLTKVNESNDTSSNSRTFKANKKLSETVSLGQYIATVQGNSRSATQVIKLGSHKTLNYKIDANETLGVEPVAYIDARSVEADNNQLLYVNANENDSRLYKIDNHNSPSPSSSQQFQSVKWLDTSFGIGEDSSGRLYIINNGSVKQINMPSNFSEQFVNFDVSPDKQIYMSNGSNVYHVSDNGSPNKIYSSTYSSVTLSASLNKIAVANQTEGQGTTGSSNPLLAIMDPSGANIIKKGLESEKLTWSPNGQYLINATGTSLDIYDAKLSLVASIPVSSPVLYLKWSDSNTFFYSVNDQLWSYNLVKQRADLLANMPLGDLITGLTVSSDKSYVYLSTSRQDGNNPSIRRVGLIGQQVPDYIYQLQDILPKNLKDCTISLINFANPPTILIQPFRSSSLSPTAIVQEVQSELSSDGFDISKLNFSLAQSN